MKTRILSALIMLPLMIVVYLGGYLLMGFCFIVGVIGLVEFYNAFEKFGLKAAKVFGIIGLLALYIINLMTLYYMGDSSQEGMLLWFFLVVIGSLLYLFVHFETRKPEEAFLTAFGLLYVGYFSFHIILIDQTPYSILIWLVVLTAFGTDIFAYFTGYIFGKHKLCPAISPKKTIEGAVGGVFGSIILSLAFILIVQPDLLIHGFVIGVLGSIISQFGDLTASIIKRKIGIKDYGNLIPGHGGILDRFDSVLFTAPFVYYYIIWII